VHLFIPFLIIQHLLSSVLTSQDKGEKVVENNEIRMSTLVEKRDNQYNKITSHGYTNTSNSSSNFLLSSLLSSPLHSVQQVQSQTILQSQPQVQPPIQQEQKLPQQSQKTMYRVLLVDDSGRK